MPDAYVFKYKCLSCALHFALYTEQSARWATNAPTCPECQNHERFLVWSEPLHDFIFNVIPGKTPPQGLMGNHAPPQT